MASSSPFEGVSDLRSSQLERLFGLAQVVAPDAERAMALVEQTIRRARQEGIHSEGEDPGSMERQWIDLSRILLDVHADRLHASEDLPLPRRLEDEPRVAPEEPGPAGELGAFRRRLAQRFVDAALPGAFATLRREHRILLLLCDVQGMHCADAGHVLRTEPEAACARLADARAALRRALYANATEIERRLVDTGLSDGWLRDALRRMVESELSAIPPTLLPEVTPDPAGPSSPAGSAGASTARSPGHALGRLSRRAFAILLVIAVAGALGYGFSWLTRRTPDVNLISLSARQAGSVEAAFQTTSAEQVERYVRDRLGRRISVPTISEAALQGVSIRDVADGAEAPVIVYQGADGTAPVVVYVYSYAFLDTHREQLQLSTDVLNQIETEGHFDLHDLGQEKALIWRRRDDIYVAITGGDPEALRERISFPS